MPPHDLPSRESYAFFETDVKPEEAGTFVVPPSAEKRQYEIVWRNVFALTVLHLGGLYGGYLFFKDAMWMTDIFTVLLYVLYGLGVTAGSHRYWSHRTYKARFPLQLLLLFLQTGSFQGSVMKWSRDHRVHHKYSETDADPHNSTRGFFFSHMGWLLVKKHPQLIEKGSAIDFSDLNSNPILRFQKKYYVSLAIFVAFVLPTYIATTWGESVWNAFFVCGMFKTLFLLHVTLLFNSVAHLWGYRPYDKYIKPADVPHFSLFVFGESTHNYHHTFPWDYKTEEIGYFSFNLTRWFIDSMTKIGWAYDLKTVSPDVVKQRVKRTGDGTHSVWGWDDKDVTLKDKEDTTIVNPLKEE